MSPIYRNNGKLLVVTKNGVRKLATGPKCCCNQNSINTLNFGGITSMTWRDDDRILAMTNINKLILFDREKSAVILEYTTNLESIHNVSWLNSNTLSVTDKNNITKTINIDITENNSKLVATIRNQS